MRIRTVALTLALGLLAAPLPVEAQQAGKVHRLGYLSGVSRSVGGRLADVFLEELRDLGWAKGQNLIVEERWAEGKTERLPDLAGELVRLKVDVIHVVATQATVAAVNSTRTIPIVFSLVRDPVEQGLVASLAQPGGNVTGLATIGPELAGKRLELLKEAVPEASRVAFLWDPRGPGVARILRQSQSAAQALGMRLQPVEVRDPDEFEAAFDIMTTEGADAVFVGDTLLFTHRRRIAELALANRLPTIFLLPQYVREGGLMSYTPNLVAMFKRAAHLVDKILKGANPATLPVERPTKFELVINLKTATGECEVIGDKLGGIAVHMGARVAAMARPVKSWSQTP